jgi:hypothetical protein
MGGPCWASIPQDSWLHTNQERFKNAQEAGVVEEVLGDLTGEFFAIWPNPESEHKDAWPEPKRVRRDQLPAERRLYSNAEMEVWMPLRKKVSMWH